MAAWLAGNVVVDGLRLHYNRTGGDLLPVVLAHGVGDDGLCWTMVAEALEARFDVIMVDARGHGLSSAPERGYDPATQAADLAGVIAALGLRRPAILGHSMGALTTLVLAGSYPDVPRAILLEDPPPWWLRAEQSPAATQARAGIRAGLAELKRKTRAELIAGERAASPGWADAEFEPWADAKIRFSPNVLDLFNSNPAADIAWPELLPRISCPALLITADPAHGALATPESAVALQAQLPQLRISNIPQAGHSVRRDQFGRYLDAVNAFLDEVVARS